jgi:outer membrane protein OmpA-like peptidoglycan-associated protein
MRALFLAPLLLPSLLMAQERLLLTGESDARTVLVRGQHEGEEAAGPVLQATWRFAGEDVDPVMSFQRTSLNAGAAELSLDELVLAGFGAYLDARVHFEKQGVRADLPVDVMVRQLNGMVRAATDELGEGDGVAAVSEPTMQQLDRLCHIDWSQARFGVDGGAEQDKYLAIFYYVRSQRDELERQLRADLLPLATVPVIREEELPPGRAVSVNSLCGSVFDDRNFLCALDLGVTDTTLVMTDVPMDAYMLLALQRPSPPAPVAEEFKVRKRDRWLKTELDRINERIDEVDQRKELWALRDRLDDLDGRLDDLSMELREVREEGVPTGNPIAELSVLTGRNVTVRFSKGGVVLDSDGMVLLNEVFEQLARDPAQRILITGHSDASGDPATNLVLSERRAKAVRSYLVARGVEEERLLVNFYGDSRSIGPDAAERRVEIEWLP